MNIVVNEELKAYIDPLTPEEYDALERSILAEGCRDALVLWGDVLVDGHNRYGICQKHGLPFQTVQNTRFQSIEDVHLWMIDQHLGRRSVSDFQRGVLALRKKEIVAGAGGRARAAAPADAGRGRSPSTRRRRCRRSAARQPRGHRQGGAPEQQPGRDDREDPEAGRARAGGGGQVRHDLDQRRGRRGHLPAEEQIAAANAGKDELKQAAKRVREAKRPARAEAAGTPGPAEEPDAVAQLTRRVAELTAENDDLRRQVAALHALLQAAEA